jgi:GTPase SAR1 family protein
MDLSANVVVQWISEVAHFCPGVPVLLVGCKQDLRNSPIVIEQLKMIKQRPVTPEEVRYDSARYGSRF